MELYHIFVIDAFNELNSIYKPLALRLSEWFHPIAKAAGFERSSIQFPLYKEVKPRPHELLIYMCPVETSVVQKMPGINTARLPNPTNAGHQGATLTANGYTGSEVWAGQMGETDVNAFAAMIFHEAMHNKLQLGSALHTRFLPRCQLSCATVSWHAAPSDAESEAMSRALTTGVPQWLGGLELLWNAASRKSKGDPEWAYDIKYKG